MGQVPCPREARGQAGPPRVAQLVKARRSGCDLGLFRVERIPLLPFQAAICPLVVTDGPQKRDRQQHSECPWHLLLHLEWRIAGLSTTRRIYGALSGASRLWPCHTPSHPGNYGGRGAPHGKTEFASISAVFFIGLLRPWGAAVSGTGEPRGSILAGLGFEPRSSQRADRET